MTVHRHEDRGSSDPEDENSKEIIRYSGCLGVRRVYGSHTFDVIAKAIADIHAEFKITSNSPRLTLML